ncbi:MAG: mechanosensitive ion channel [Duncaniella sp.]|uniref:mechanosensitive ion channel family protein n=1 Tax=Duncaniella sp. TaxID=2518496 RepID=UPI0023CB0F43|nr:mechanosensitive ion channel domain-containing protein [Duncaniella sp.]MDE5989869.1 mechanosensitive ion channel [Duncaniella sp.]MDE6174377.1 mechanosensitive ion channel [Duncaniella sp.]
MIQLDILPTDSIPTVAQESGALKNISFDQLIDTLISDMVHFAISLTVAILVFYAGKYIIRKLYNFVYGILHRRQVEASLSTFVLSLVRIVLYFILIVTVIGILGIETSSFLALFASAGVAIGMALSGTLQNFAGGVLILLLKPFKVGDYIEAQGFAGTVTRIEIFNTIICTADNKSIIIPNGGLSTGSINNYSIQPYRRVDWTIGISYGESIDQARSLILELLRKDRRVLWDEKPEAPSVKAPVVVVSALADSSVNLSVRAWVASADYWGVFFDHNEEFYNAITAAPGLSFPFPQLDVHVVPASDDRQA